MGLREEIRIPAGHRLVVEGLCGKTLRDPDFPRGWAGLGPDDAYLLRRWVDNSVTRLRCLHTDVPVGVVPVGEGLADNAFVQAQLAVLHPLRIDVCVELVDGWRVCEIKPDAGYVSLGQVLTYQYFACRTCPELAEARAMVLTDRVQEAIRPVFERFDVELVEVGQPGDPVG